MEEPRYPKFEKKGVWEQISKRGRPTPPFFQSFAGTTVADRRSDPRADHRSEAGPSPRQLKFEILAKIEKQTEKNGTKTKTQF